MRYYICRVKTYSKGWTIEAFSSLSGGWWVKMYDAYTGLVATTPATQFPTFRKALSAGVRVARSTRLPQAAIDYYAGIKEAVRP